MPSRALRFFAITSEMMKEGMIPSVKIAIESAVGSNIFNTDGVMAKPPSSFLSMRDAVYIATNSTLSQTASSGIDQPIKV